MFPQEKNMVVFAEETAVDDPVVLQDENFSAVRSKLYIFKEGDSSIVKRFGVTIYRRNHIVLLIWSSPLICFTLFLNGNDGSNHFLIFTLSFQ